MTPTLKQSLTHSDNRRRRWPLYFIEAGELGIFMVSACLFTVLLYRPESPVVRWLPNSTLRRLLMGMSMGLTAIGIIKSSWGKRSGAHFNPAITLTFLRLGKISGEDAIFYAVFQFFGAVAGVGLSAALLGRSLAGPAVNYAVTVPGPSGSGAAFAAELFMSALLMAVVLITSDQPRLAPYTAYCMGLLITIYVLVFAPVSGFSMNPARTTGSAVFAEVWTAIWIYFTAPILGMLLPAELYLRLKGVHSIQRTGSRKRRHYFTHRHLTRRQDLSTDHSRG